METHKTLEEARVSAKSRGDIVSIIEIDHATEGRCYIKAKVGMGSLAYGLKRKPMAEIRRLIAEYDVEDREAALRALYAAVPGLAELRAAADDEIRYREQFERMMEDESNDGACPPKPVAANYSDLASHYPIAAAYLKAESWEMGSHYAKSSAGRKAKARIAAGEDYEQALRDMDAEWAAHCREHIWD